MSADKAVISNLKWFKEFGQEKEIPLRRLANAHVLRGAKMVTMDDDLKFTLTEKGEEYLNQSK